jgi:hypothetical protein
MRGVVGNTDPSATAQVSKVAYGPAERRGAAQALARKRTALKSVRALERFPRRCPAILRCSE